MTPFSSTLHKLSFIGGRKKKELCATGKSDICGDSDICGARSRSPVDHHPFEEPPCPCEPPAINDHASTDGCPLELPPASNAKPPQKFEAFCGPCTIGAKVEPPPCPEECDQQSINTFLRPDNLLMGDANIRMDQTKPYLVGNKLMREIPIRDTTKILNDKELRSLHWVIGESVERHAERTARYFANLFRSKELADVIIYVGENKVKCHKLVLAAFSPRFNKQFIRERPERMLMPEVCIDVSQLQTRALLRCIEFMYKGSTEIHHYNAADILNVAQALKIFSLAQMCKDKLKSMQFSDLLPNSPRTKKDALRSTFVRGIESGHGLPAANDDPNGAGCGSCEPCAPAYPVEAVDGVRSQDSVRSPTCNREDVCGIQRKEDLRQEEAANVLCPQKGPIDFYKITGQSSFLAWPIESVEALFTSDEIKINSELDIVDAMIRWIQFRPDPRKNFAERLLDCVRFIHTTPHEMLDCKHLIPELFELGPLRSRMAKAKWTRDLLERGVAPHGLTLPPCRVNRKQYWNEQAETCETPIDNIYGEETLEASRPPFKSNSEVFQGGRAARTILSKKANRLLCQQSETTRCLRT